MAHRRICSNPDPGVGMPAAISSTTTHQHNCQPPALLNLSSTQAELLALPAGAALTNHALLSCDLQEVRDMWRACAMHVHTHARLHATCRRWVWHMCRPVCPVCPVCCGRATHSPFDCHAWSLSEASRCHTRRVPHSPRVKRSHMSHLTRCSYS